MIKLDCKVTGYTTTLDEAAPGLWMCKSGAFVHKNDSGTNWAYTGLDGGVYYGDLSEECRPVTISKYIGAEDE